MSGDDVRHCVVVAAVTDVQKGIVVVAVTDVGHVCISRLSLLACLRSTAMCCWIPMAAIVTATIVASSRSCRDVRDGVVVANNDVALIWCCCRCCCWHPIIMVVSFICKLCWLFCHD